MSRFLKITKSDKTTHIAPLQNKAALTSYNNRLPADQKWKIEEIDESEVASTPYIDESYVTAAEAIGKNQELTAALSDRDKKIAELEAMLAKQNGGQAPVVAMKANEKIELIKAATSVDQVKELVGDDERTSVVAAGDKKIAELEAQ